MWSPYAIKEKPDTERNGSMCLLLASNYKANSRHSREYRMVYRQPRRSPVDLTLSASKGEGVAPFHAPFRKTFSPAFQDFPGVSLSPSTMIF